MTTDSLASAFVRHARGVLAGYPALTHEWQLTREESGTLRFPSSPSGFEVRVTIDRGSLIVFALGGHEHFNRATRCQALESLAADALGFVRDLLSPDMRIREVRAGDRPFRWVIERRTPGGWTAEAATTTIPWNFLSPRSERIYQNHQLPGRLSDPVI